MKTHTEIKDDPPDTENESMPIKRLKQFADHKGLQGRGGYGPFYSKAKIAADYFKNTKNPSIDVINRIRAVFPELNGDWVMTGRGEMLLNGSLEESIDEISSQEVSDEARSRPLPVYDIQVVAGKNSLVNTTDYEYIIGWARVPGFEDCIGAVKTRGDSMAPIIKTNSEVFIRPAVSKKLIEWGSMYVVVFGGDMPPHPMLKYVRKGPDSRTVILRSHNEKYEDMEVALDDIMCLYPARAGIIEF